MYLDSVPIFRPSLRVPINYLFVFAQNTLYVRVQCLFVFFWEAVRSFDPLFVHTEINLMQNKWKTHMLLLFIVLPT